jgi:two-component sensor histidine kinase
MVAHELATNAAKYGALSVVTGCVSVSWTIAADGGLSLVWTERGGPRLEGAPARRGFGTRLIEASVRRQLAGALDLRWDASGLTCAMLLPAECLRAATRAEAG